MGANWEVPSGKIKVKIIPKGVNPLIEDPDHEAFNLFGNATRTYALPMDRFGNLINPFSSEGERAWLEESLDMDLNYHKSKDNYFMTAEVKLGKNDKILDKANPKDYLELLILKANTLYFAPSFKERKELATYKYMLIAENEETNAKASTAKLRTEAYKYLGKVEDDKDAMLNFLKVYGNKVSPVSKISFLVNEMENLIVTDLEGFLDIAKNEKNFKLKLLINDAVVAGAINKEKKKYFLPGGDALAGEGEVPTLENVVAYLKNPANQDILAMITAKTNVAK